MNRLFSALLALIYEPALVIELLPGLSTGVHRLAGPYAGRGGETAIIIAPSAAGEFETFGPSGQVFLGAG